MIHHRHQRSWKLPRLRQSWRQNAFLLAALSLFPTNWPRWAVMWSLALAIYSGCKWLTWQHKSAPKAPWGKDAGYFFAWPGMDAEAFLNGECDVPVLWGKWLFAGGKLAFGLL